MTPLNWKSYSIRRWWWCQRRRRPRTQGRGELWVIEDNLRTSIRMAVSPATGRKQKVWSTGRTFTWPWYSSLIDSLWAVVYQWDWDKDYWRLRIYIFIYNLKVAFSFIFSQTHLHLCPDIFGFIHLPTYPPRRS